MDCGQTDSWLEIGTEDDLSPEAEEEAVCLALPSPEPSVQESKERKAGILGQGSESSLGILQAQQDPVQCVCVGGWGRG